MSESIIVSLATICAIIIGPLLAVQVTRYLDDRKDKRQRQLSIHRSLMATRASDISQEHVSALNSIDLEFSGDKFKNVTRAWKECLAHLGKTDIPIEQWAHRRKELLIDLLDHMGKALGYDFDRVQIEQGVCHPRVYGEIEEDQREIRRGLKRLLAGKQVIPLHVVNLAESQAPSGSGRDEDTPDLLDR